MIYELQYDLDSQIVVNTFVREDYLEMSNAMVGHYPGRSEDSDDELEVMDAATEDFDKWLQ